VKMGVRGGGGTVGSDEVVWVEMCRARQSNG